jgi:hypothetical protein
MPEKKKTDSRILLIWSIAVMALGLTVVLFAPVVHLWTGVELQVVKLAKITLPSGWAICVLSLAMQAIEKLPDIVEAIRQVKK